MGFDGNGKVVLITGAGSGMGRLAAERLAAAGAQIAGLDVNEQALASTAAAVDGFEAWPADVTDARAIETLVTAVEAKLGPIDRVMNAAAIMPTDLLVDQEQALKELHTLIGVDEAQVIEQRRMPTLSDILFGVRSRRPTNASESLASVLFQTTGSKFLYFWPGGR